MKYKTALFVARLQPPHKGHMNAIREILKKYKKIVIAVGSINKHDKNNPFSFHERKSMLNAVLRKYKNRCKIIGVQDVKSDRKWAKEIMKKAKFDVVVTANPWTAKCFSGYKIVKPKMVNQKKYNGTRIRKMIRENKQWKSLVPKQIVPIIKKRG